jgi:MFS family permease
MIVADVGRFAAVASIPLAYACGALTMVPLYVTEFAVGALTVLFRVCNHHVYASVVAAERYVDGNALLSVSRSAAAVAGPSTGGALVQILSAPFALLVDAVTYLVSAVCLGRIRSREAPPAPRETGGLAAGLRWVTAHRTPGLLLAGVSMLSLCHTFLMTLFVLYWATELGLLAGALGAVVAAAGCGVAVLDIAANSYIGVIPPALRSRVMGVVQTANFGVRPIGAVLAGTLGAALGLRTTLWIGTAGAVLSVLGPSRPDCPASGNCPRLPRQVQRKQRSDPADSRSHPRTRLPGNTQVTRPVRPRQGGRHPRCGRYAHALAGVEGWEGGMAARTLPGIGARSLCCAPGGAAAPGLGSVLGRDQSASFACVAGPGQVHLLG